MKEPLYIKNEIVIETDADTVWDVLTEGDFTKQYMFGCEPKSEWEPGDSIEWVGNMDGKEVCFVKGQIVEFNPPQKLSYTTIDPNGDYEDVPENYLTVTYLLEPQGKSTKFTVTQGDYSIAAEGKARYEETMEAGGWSSILEQIKLLAENLD
ncbi:MAG: SRPBCC domain-containing protein [Saprospiraceae bacterium]